MSHRSSRPAAALSALFLLAATLECQQTDERKFSLEVSPQSLELEIGESAELEISVVGEDGDALSDIRFFCYTGSRCCLDVDSDGGVTALFPGEFFVEVRTERIGGRSEHVRVPVVVPFPPLERIEFTAIPETIFEGTSTPIATRAVDIAGLERVSAVVEYSSSDAGIAYVDDFGNLVGAGVGEVEIIARAESVEARSSVRVRANPVVSLELTADQGEIRTGDVVHFSVVTRDADGSEVAGVPVLYTFEARAESARGETSIGQITQTGRFVADKPGQFTIVASCGGAAASKTIRATQRDVGRRIELVGRGSVPDVHTSDLWVWEGIDGRDYAVTGTWGANGDAIFWDVTDPSEITEISRVTVDARTVNDVKVSEDGRLCVLSREGASNRKNGIVLISVENPREPEILSTFTENLTGGVHNLFIYEDHVYALSAGQRYDVIDISNPLEPHRVGSFEFDGPDPSIHDVWVVDGLAYSSNWHDGVQIVDVGNGIAGGSPENPVLVSGYEFERDWNHAAFPFKNEETGKFYVIGGDEAFPYGLNIEDHPTYPRGWLHFVDFTDMENPEEVARYEVPEAGSHNLWVEGDLLYAAFYNGGLRVVDISGDLMGDLYAQGREVAWFRPTDPEGKVANAPMTWGPQPHKGHIFFSDWNSGLWSVKLENTVEQ